MPQNRTNSGWLLALCLALFCNSHDTSVGQQGKGRETEAIQSSPTGTVLVATCQFPVSSDVAANAEWIHKQLRRAKGMHADIVHFPECALSGYWRQLGGAAAGAFDRAFA